MSLQISFGAIYAVAAGISLWSLAQLNRFLAETRSIADETCLERSKAVVRIQMYLALVLIVTLTAGVIAGVIVIARHGVRGFLAVILANALVLGLGLYHKTVEARVRSLRAGSEALANEYRRVCDTWTKKAVPDF
jgi:uncharacterized membrane protein